MDLLATDSVGSRLRSERERLQMSQEQLATVGGVRKLTQIQYEKDNTSPTANYLVAVASVGVDVVEVLGLAGQKTPLSLTKRQESLLHHYAQASRAGKLAIERYAMLEGQQAPVVSRASTDKPAKKARKSI